MCVWSGNMSSASMVSSPLIGPGYWCSMTDPRSMSKEATRMYSTWFSMESAGYWERSRACLVSPKDETWDSSSIETSSSRTIGGCGERGGRLFSLRRETAEGLRDGGNEEKEGWRWRPG